MRIQSPTIEQTGCGRDVGPGGTRPDLRDHQGRKAGEYHHQEILLAQSLMASMNSSKACSSPPKFA